MDTKALLEKADNWLAEAPDQLANKLLIKDLRDHIQRKADCCDEQTWQPIETVPDDETVIMACGNGAMYMARAPLKRPRLVCAEELEGGKGWALTHWMPLPKPPVTTDLTHNQKDSK